MDFLSLKGFNCNAMEDTIMNNGITIEKHQDGIIVDGILHILNSDEETDVVSEYFFPDYWKNFIANPSQGEISPNSLFIKYESYAPLPCASGFTLFTYCNSTKFVAGYLKFMVLCEIISSTLIDLSEFAEFSNGNNISFDIDCFIQNYETEDSNKKEICEKIKHILRLCNLVFLEQNEQGAKNHLFYTANKFNEYFSEILGWDFEFKVYDGAGKAKDEILSFISSDSDREFVSSVMLSDIWNDEEKQTLADILESLVG